MYQDDTDILFPMRVAPTLRDLKGRHWRRLVDRVCCSPEASTEQLAFTLLLIRLSGCLSCHTDSFRAMRGCTQCAAQSVRRFRGDDGDLLRQFERARDEVLGYLQPSRAEPATRHQ